MVVYIINGYPRSGKDTFCELIGNHYRTAKFSTVDTPKRVLKSLGWDGEKTPQVREALSTLKDMYTYLFDGPFKESQKFILKSLNSGIEFAFVMCREPPEIKRLQVWCCEIGISCLTLFIQRECEEELTNHADKDVEKFDYDVYLDNNGNIKEFEYKIIQLINIIDTDGC